jgi:glycosyltransferase involved in cell wall biosynthesis
MKKKGKKILILIDWPAENGFSLAKELEIIGYDCELQGINYSARQWNPFMKYILLWIKCCWRSYNVFKKKDNYDFIITWQQVMGFWLGFFKLIHFKNTPKVFIPIMSVMERKNSLSQKIRSLLIKAILPKIDVIGISTQACKKEIQENFGLIHPNLMILPFSINLEKYPFNGELNLDNYIFSIGISNRDYSTLIKVAKKVDKQFVIVTQPFAMKHIENIPANVKIYYNTFGEEAKALYRNAGIIILLFEFNNSSSGETCILEAKWYGKPLIATRTVITESFITHEKDGYLVSHKSVDEIVNIINNIYRDPDKAKQIAQNARNFVEQNNSMTEYAKRINQILENYSG